MKRILTAICLLAFLCLGGRAESVPAETAFQCAKEALSLISYGEFDRAIARLGMEGTLSGAELKNFINANCPEIYAGSVQTEVSVAWYDQNRWLIAVPFEAPDDNGVGALVFSLTDGVHFDAVFFARWGKVAESYSLSDSVNWNVAYTPGYIIVGDW